MGSHRPALHKGLGIGGFVPTGLELPIEETDFGERGDARDDGTRGGPEPGALAELGRDGGRGMGASMHEGTVPCEETLTRGGERGSDPALSDRPMVA